MFIPDNTAESAARVQDAVNQGYAKVPIRTVDTNVIVIVVMAAQRLNIGELGFHFATGRNSGS